MPISNDDLKEIEGRIAACETYYPSDSDLWPSALRYAIEDRKTLVAAFRELQQQLGHAEQRRVDLLEDKNAELATANRRLAALQQSSPAPSEALVPDIVSLFQHAGNSQDFETELRELLNRASSQEST